MKQAAIFAVVALTLAFGTGRAALAARGHGHHGHHGHGHHGHHSGFHLSFGVGHHYGHHAYSYPHRSYSYSYPRYRYPTYSSYSYPTYSSYRYPVQYRSCSTYSYRVIRPAAPIQQTIESKSLPAPDVDTGKPEVDPAPEPVAIPTELNFSAARENDVIRSRLHLVGLRVTNPVSQQSSSKRVAREKATAQAGPLPELQFAVPTVRPLVSDNDAPWIVE